MTGQPTHNTPVGSGQDDGRHSPVPPEAQRVPPRGEIQTPTNRSPISSVHGEAQREPRRWDHLYICGNCGSDEIEEANENDAKCADCGEWMNTDRVEVVEASAYDAAEQTIERVRALVESEEGWGDDAADEWWASKIRAALSTENPDRGVGS